MEIRFRLIPFVALALLNFTEAHAQEADAEAPQATEDNAEASTDGLLTAAELETLVAPVALYPDTLLIQILVAATTPIDVVKADRLLLQNAEATPDALEEEIKAQAYDPSVEVLAIAFPDIISRMAENIEWTETIGNAMLVQSDTVMAAVQVMREQAINSGALIDSEEQTVTRDEESDAVVIQPTDPEVVYVPQYDHTVVYEDDTDLGDVVMAGLITWGTIALIDDIFDDDDDWYGYWGCHNCGGWGGRPIYPYPDVGIDIDGNVNIGNDINIGGRNPDGSWRPGEDKQDRARDQLSQRKDKKGAATLEMGNRNSDRDALRANLSEKSGARDISRDGTAGALGGSAKRSPQEKSKSLKRSSDANKKISKPSAQQKLPKASGTHKTKASQKPKLSKQHSGRKAKASSKRSRKRRG